MVLNKYANLTEERRPWQAVAKASVVGGAGIAV